MTEWMRDGRRRGSAKVQIGAELLCKSAKVNSGVGVGLTILGRPRSSRDARPYLIQLYRDAVPTLPITAQETWSQLLKAERLTPERPMPWWLSPVTRYVPLTFAPLHRPEADLHFCTSANPHSLHPNTPAGDFFNLIERS
jgi:hypothetical protein